MDKGRKTLRRYLAYALVILAMPLAQFATPRLLGRDLPELAYYLTLLASSLATLYAASQLRFPTCDRRGMACLALGLACWSAGMACAIALSGTEDNLISTYVLFVSYGVPLLYAAVANRDESVMLSRRIVDASLLVLLVTLCYLGVHDLSDTRGFLKSEDMVWVVAAFDVENVFLFVTFLARWLTATDEREHRFFRQTTIFLGLYAIAAGLHNHQELHAHVAFLGQLSEAMPTVPFMALVCLLHAGRRPEPFVPTRHLWARRLSGSLAPGLVLGAIFALSLGIDADEGPFGRVVLALAMLAYVVRVTQTQYWFAKTRDRLAEALDAVERLSLLDPLTGIPNRRAFDRALVERTRESIRDGKPLSVLMVDVDHFKSLNDTRGHPEGDVVLQGIARLLAGTLRRPADFIARYGGEEFAALLPGTHEDGARIVARRMIRAVYDAELENDFGIDGRVTVSIGVATTCPATHDLVHRADKALYVAKSSGRNRCADAATPETVVG